MKICREIDIHEFNCFSAFVEDVLPESSGVNFNEDTGELPCYMNLLSYTDYAQACDVPAMLEAACHFAPSQDNLIFLSITSKEENHQAWLDALIDYPGAIIHEWVRNPEDVNNRRIIWTILFPVTPVL